MINVTIPMCMMVNIVIIYVDVCELASLYPLIVYILGTAYLQATYIISGLQVFRTTRLFTVITTHSQNQCCKVHYDQ